MELNQTEKQNKKIILKSEDILRNFWDNIKWNNICFIGVPEGEEREGQKNNLKTQWLKTSLVWGRKQISTSRKPRNFQIR